MGPYQRTPKEVARAIRYSDLGVHSMGPVGNVLDHGILGNVLFNGFWHKSTDPF